MIMIRELRMPDDRSAALHFIDGSQAYEGAFELNRRLDGRVAAEHFEALLRSVRERQGRMLVAEVDWTVSGWACCFVQEHGVFIKEDERRSGYISEIYVDEAYRGRHIGRALIAACEDHFRRMGLNNIVIGALSGNARAIAAYRSAGFADYSVELRKYI